MGPRGREAPAGGAAGASGERSEVQAGAALGVAGRADEKHGSRPSSATLTHSHSHDSGYGSELGEASQRACLGIKCFEQPSR